MEKFGKFDTISGKYKAKNSANALFFCNRSKSCPNRSQMAHTCCGGFFCCALYLCSSQQTAVADASVNQDGKGGDSMVLTVGYFTFYDDG